MKLGVATALCVATLALTSLNAVSAADEAKAGAGKKKKLGRKALPTQARHNRAQATVDDKVLAEDEGYWERFLQDAESSIPGFCKTVTTITCKIDMPDGSTIDCNTPPPPQGPEDCGPAPVEYCYTISNEGDDCGNINSITRTRTPGGTVDLIGLVPEGERFLCPGDNVVVCEADTVDTCDEQCYETTVEVNADMPNSGFVCNSSDEYDFCIEPGCITEVTTECQIEMPDGTFIECKDVPEYPPDACPELPTEYCYTISNVGSTCGEITNFFRTRTPPGSTDDLIGLIAPEDRELCAGDSIRVCETTMTDTCVDACYVTTVEVEVTMPDSQFVCAADDVYDFCVGIGTLPPTPSPTPPPTPSPTPPPTPAPTPGTPPPTPSPTPPPTPSPIGTCTVTVETDCQATLADGTTLPCDEMTPTVDDCGEVMKEYCYVITNIGNECGDITEFQRRRTPPGGEFVDLLPGLIASGAQTNLCQGDSVRYCDPMETIDSCDDQCYLTEVSVEMTMPENDFICEATDTYELCVNPGCIIETDITCTIDDGSGTSCEDFPTASVEDCGLVPVEYCYTIENTGPTCGTINSIVRTRTPPGTPEDILAVLIPNAADRLLCEGESITACETAEVDSCVEQCYDTTILVDAQMSDGFVCSADDEYEFCVPPPTESPPCNVEVDVSCEVDPSRSVDGSTNCDTIIPIATRCDKRASVLTWRFNGGDCEQSFNIQEADKFTCTDFDGGAPTEGSAWILVTSVKDQEDVYFEGEVRVGDLFSMFAANSSAGKFDADSFFYVYADSSKSQLLQLSSVHTSCSQNLFLKDKFGGVQLLIFENEFGLFTCFVQATYGFSITNQGSTESGQIVEFTSTTNGITDDCLSVIPEDQRVVPGGGTLDVDKQILIDMTIRQEYNTLAYIRAETPEGVTCEDTATESFTAGNPSLPNFGVGI